MRAAPVGILTRGSGRHGSRSLVSAQAVAFEGEPGRKRAPRAPVTWRLVLVPGAAKVAFQLATVNLYGPHRDEFSYLVSGQHPAWGYVDNPPLVPWLYRLQELAFGHSMGALAVVPALLGGVLVVLAAVMISDRRSRVLGLERRWR